MYCSVLKQCTPTSTSHITLSGPYVLSGYLVITLKVLLNTTWTILPSNAQFLWKVQTSSINALKINAINRFLQNQTDEIITISSKLLEPGVEYNISVSVIDYLGVNTSSRLDITLICPRATFRIPGSGCSGNCLTGCFKCSNASTCEVCAPYAILNSTSLSCYLNSFIDLQAPNLISPCSNFSISASIDQNEAGYGQIRFKWEMYYKLGSTPFSLENLLEKETGSVLTLNASLLDDDKYIVTVSYINFLGQKISNSTIITIGSSDLPTIIVEGGSLQTIKRDELNYLKISSYYSGCYTSAIQTKATWYELPTPKLLQSDGSNTFWLPIAKCSIKESSQFMVRVYTFSSIIAINYRDITVITGRDTFKAEIENSNRTHPVLENLVLSGKAIWEISCLDTNKNNLLYSWSCFNISNQQSCNDLSSNFNSYSSTNSIFIPYFYFKLGIAFCLHYPSSKMISFLKPGAKLI